MLNLSIHRTMMITERTASTRLNPNYQHIIFLHLFCLSSHGRILPPAPLPTTPYRSPPRADPEVARAMSRSLPSRLAGEMAAEHPARPLPRSQGKASDPEPETFRHVYLTLSSGPTVPAAATTSHPQQGVAGDSSHESTAHSPLKKLSSPPPPPSLRSGPDPSRLLRRPEGSGGRGVDWPAALQSVVAMLGELFGGLAPSVGAWPRSRAYYGCVRATALGRCVCNCQVPPSAPACRTKLGTQGSEGLRTCPAK